MSLCYDHHSTRHSVVCVSGATADSLANSSQSGDNSTIKIVSIVIDVIFGILGVAIVLCYAKKEFNNVIQR